MLKTITGTGNRTGTRSRTGNRTGTGAVTTAPTPPTGTGNKKLIYNPTSAPHRFYHSYYTSAPLVLSLFNVRTSAVTLVSLPHPTVFFKIDVRIPSLSNLHPLAWQFLTDFYHLIISLYCNYFLIIIRFISSHYLIVL